MTTWAAGRHGGRTIFRGTNLSQRTARRALAGRTALVVDDDPDAREMLRELLEAQGMVVITAHHGWAALRELRSTRVDVIVLDLLMPIVDGWAFRRAQLRDANLATIPVVVLSAAAGAGAPISASADLEKPVAFEELLDALEEALLQGAPAPTT
ncbi:MAG: response regulator [Myxococcota bacterium]